MLIRPRHTFVLPLLFALMLTVVPTHPLVAAEARQVLVEGGKVGEVDPNHAWKQLDDAVEGQGVGTLLQARVSLGEGDFTVTATLRILEQKKSAASFYLGGNHFGFEGASGVVFVSGPIFGGQKMIGSPDKRWKRGEWMSFEASRQDGVIAFKVNGNTIRTARFTGPFDTFGLRPHRSTMQVKSFAVAGNLVKPRPVERITIPHIDLDAQTQRQVVVDREKGQYLGHPTTCLLEDGKTMLCVYPKGHGRGGIVYKRSTDGGKTWSDRLPTPRSWATSKEVPTLHRVIDAVGKKRIIMWSGLYPARLAVTEDDGKSWSELKQVGAWGGIVVMGFVEKLRTGDGHYLAMFHDDGRFFLPPGKPRPAVPARTMTLYQTFSQDGGLTWSYPQAVFASHEIHLCEPGVIRSPDGKEMAVLLRENARRRNSYVIFSDDEGKTWSKPRELPLSLTGDRHTGKYGPDGRLFISFRCRSPRHIGKTRLFEGDWIGWVGTYDDIKHGKPDGKPGGKQGQYVVRLKDNKHSWDTAYPGVELLPDGTFVTTTYGHWVKGESPFILSVRFKLSELDELAKESKGK